MKHFWELLCALHSTRPWEYKDVVLDLCISGLVLNKTEILLVKEYIWVSVPGAQLSEEEKYSVIIKYEITRD